MKKLLIIALVLSSLNNIFGQDAPIAVDDYVYANYNEIITVKPLENDIHPDGDVVITSINPINSISIINSTDSTISIKVVGYFIGDDSDFKIQYKIKYNDDNISPYAYMHILPNTIIDTLSVNNIKTSIFPQNIQFYDAYINNSSPNYFYPADEKTSTIFSSSLWIGGNDENGNLHLAAEKYRLNGTDFWSGPLSNDGLAVSDTINANNWFRTWKVTKKEIDQHIANFSNPNYKIPEAIENWPAHGDPNRNQDEFLAPFADVDFDLEYHPENGDYPLIKGDESVFFIYNDRNEFHSESQGSQMGVEIQCMAWAFEDVNGKEAYSSTIFFSYKILNRSMLTYTDTYVGYFADLDIGNPTNDYAGSHVENGNLFAYNGTSTDPSMGIGNQVVYGYDSIIPTQGVCILGGPFMDVDGIDNLLGECNESINGAGFGDGIVDNEMYGMTRAILYGNGWPLPYDPDVAPEYYDLMQGITTNGQTIGGDTPARFMYPGESDPCRWSTNGVDPGFGIWTEETSANQPGDRRSLASMGPFTFEAGSIHYLDIALVTAPGDQEINSKDLLQDYIVQIKQDYLQNPEEFGNQYLEIPEPSKITEQLLIYPNPAEGDIIRFEVGVEVKAEYSIYNAAGQIIAQGFLAAQKEHSLSIGHLQSGWYILEVKVDGRVLRSKLIL